MNLNLKNDGRIQAQYKIGEVQVEEEIYPRSEQMVDSEFQTKSGSVIVSDNRIMFMGPI